MARGSAPFLLAPAFATAAGMAASAAASPAGAPLSFAGLVLFALFAAFFRDPERAVAEGVCAPADGQVLSIDDQRLVIFMAPWSVHVNRAPTSATVVETSHRRGGHKPAFSKAAPSNERVDLQLHTPSGPMALALIAGTIARRIHPYVVPGQKLQRGQRIAMIAFGSRCELQLPGHHQIVVRPGQWVRAGSTTVARPPRP